MVKNRMNLWDIKAMSCELKQNIIGMRIANM